jgi:hypothetical protein
MATTTPWDLNAAAGEQNLVSALAFLCYTRDRAQSGRTAYRHETKEAEPLYTYTIVTGPPGIVSGDTGHP